MTAHHFDEEADFVLVGAGSAGCVLADRLSVSGQDRVFLIEAGGDDRPLRNPRQFLSNLMVHVPIGYARTLKDPSVNWMYDTEADPGTLGRTHMWPRGKVLGGSSSINAMLYVRGQAADYERWKELGCTGWGWDDVLPLFKRSENYEHGSDAAHGVGGPLDVADQRDRHAVSDAVVRAGQQAGLREVADMNRGDNEGVGWLQVTQRGGKRCSAAVAFLHPAMKRTNLTVRTGSLAMRVLFEGRHAVGVEYWNETGIRRVRARREVVLSGGAVNSPQLLMLSGIGDGAQLQARGIAVVADRPEVGRNLQDHFVTLVRYRLNPNVVSVNELTRGPRFLAQVARYGFGRRGLLSLSASHITAFVRSSEAVPRADIQFHILPATMDAQKLATEQRFELERQPGLTIAPCQLRPMSRGTIRLKSADPTEHPRIDPNYLDHPVDCEVAIAGLRWGRRIGEQQALAELIAHEMEPGPGLQTDEQLLEFARGYGGTLYHPVGTCRMGGDAASVVDPALRVRGVEGLRVIDASVMPEIISGNTNAPTVMIGEKGVDLLLGATR